MSKTQRRKGHQFERDTANKYKEAGFEDARRHCHTLDSSFKYWYNKCMSKKWLQEEVVFLQQNYKQKRYKEIAKTLDRTEEAVRKKASRLGLIKGKNGKLNPNWKGGETDRIEYILVWSPEHPFVQNSKNYVYKHRLVMEEYLRKTNPGSEYLIGIGNRKYLDPEVVVHHKDGNGKNNDISNLQILTPSEHSKKHVIPNKINLAKEEIIEQYVSENLTGREIAELHDVSPTTIWRRLKEWGVTSSG